MKSKFNMGDRVIVTSDCQSYGEHGTITNIFNINSGWNSIGASVQLDNGLNRTYNQINLKLEGDNEMCKNLKESGAKYVVRVEFYNGYNKKLYAFLCYEEDIDNGDYVLCDSDNTKTLAIVKEVVPIDVAIDKNLNPTKEVICKCDMTEYNIRKENKAKKYELKNKMDKRIKELQTNQIYEMFAEKDDLLKELLKEYKEI